MYDEFYRREPTGQSDLFAESPDVRLERVKVDAIGKYFVKRLKTIFAGVAETPAVLENSMKNPLYLFCFAVGNGRGVRPALSIANDILKKLR